MQNIEVELPNGEIAEFPPGTTADVIKKAVSKFSAPKSLEQLGLRQAGPTIEAAATGRAAKMGPFQQALYGAGQSVKEPYLGAKQLTVGLTPEEQSNLALDRATEKHTEYGELGHILGDTATTALPYMGATKLAGKVLPMALAKSTAQVAAPFVGGTTVGAGSGFLKPTIGDDDRTSNTLMGAGGGLLGTGVGMAGGRLIEGLVPKNPAALRLPQSVQDKLTLGQIADKDSLIGKIAAGTEEKLQSVPIVGDIIKKARAGSWNNARDTMVADVAPTGFTPPATTTGIRETLSNIYDEYARRYASKLRGNQINPSQMFENFVASITHNPRSGVPAPDRDSIRQMAMGYYQSMFHGNPLPAGMPPGTSPIIMGTQRGTPISADADTAKQFEAFLTSKAAQWRKSNAPNSSEQAKMWEDLERAWSTSFRRQLPSSARVGMRDLDQSYAPYKTVERAAEAVGNDFGDFTPAQLMNAVKSRTPGPKFAREGGILQPEAQDMRSVFKDNIPNSGTADRASLMALASGLWFDPVSTAATVGTAVPLMTTKAGRNLMTGDSPVNAALRAVRLNKVLREGAPLAGISFADRSTGNYSEDPNAP